MTTRPHDESAAPEESDREQDSDGKVTRIPHRQKFYNDLHRIFKDFVPESEIFDEIVAAFDTASEDELREVRRKEVQRLIQNAVLVFRHQKYESSSREPRHLLTDDERERFVAGENVVLVHNQRSFISLKQLDSTFCLHYMQKQLTGQRAWQERIQSICKIKNWSEQKCQAFLSKLTTYIAHRTAELSGNELPAYLLYYICDHCIYTFENYCREREETLILDAFVRKAEVYDRVANAFEEDFPIAQTEQDKDVIRSVKDMNEADRSLLLVQNLHQRSDTIREAVIPDLIARHVPAQEAFWAIHAAHFEHPFLAHMHSNNQVDVEEYPKNKGGAALYEHGVGKTRKIHVTSGPNGHVYPEYLPRLEEKFFTALEASIPHITSEDAFLDFVTKVDMFLLTAHLPFDGSGRTTEDFIVYLGQRLGYPLTTSTSGYRHVSSLLVEDRTDANDHFKIESERISLQSLGLEPDPTVPAEKWKGYVVGMLENLEDRPNSTFESERALEADRLIHMIGDEKGTEQIQERYKTFDERRKIWKRARAQHYVTASTPDINAACDAFIAEKNVNGTDATNEKLAALEKEHPADPLVHSLAETFLRPTHPVNMYTLAIMKRKAGKGDEAIVWFQKLLELIPDDVDSLNYIAAILNEHGKFREAIPYAREALRINPTKTELIHNLATLLLQAGESAEAETLLYSIVNSNEKFAPAYLNLARLHVLQGNTERAVAHYRRYLQLAPNDSAVQEELENYLKTLDPPVA